MNIFAYFFGWPSDPINKSARVVFEQHGGREIVAGTTLVGMGRREWSIQYDVAADRIFTCREELKKIGCRLESMSCYGTELDDVGDVVTEIANDINRRSR